MLCFALRLQYLPREWQLLRWRSQAMIRLTALLKLLSASSTCDIQAHNVTTGEKERLTVANPLGFQLLLEHRFR